MLNHTYCWWFRNPIPNHRLDGAKKTLVNNDRFQLPFPQLVNERISGCHQQYQPKLMPIVISNPVPCANCREGPKTNRNKMSGWNERFTFLQNGGTNQFSFIFFWFPPKKPEIHPGRLTWNLKITYLKRKIIFQSSIIMFHVNLRGCKFLWLTVCGFTLIHRFGSAVLSSSHGSNLATRVLKDMALYGCWTKNSGKHPKMDGENHGKPY